MIRRNVEYVIVCDAPRLLGSECHQVGGDAFGDITQADCAASALKYGWLRVTSRFWLCKRCAEDYKRLKPDTSG